MPPDGPGTPGAAAAPEFSRPLALGLVGAHGRREVLEAAAAERDALARRFGIPGIAGLRADLHLAAEPDGAVLVRGRLEAAVTQSCGVTLEPVEQAVAEDVALRLLPPGRAPQDGPEDLDEVETGPDGVADLGEAIAEQLALALDPYPRAPGAELPPEAAAQDGGGAFAALAALRREG